jgi:hypothetical protein
MNILNFKLVRILVAFGFSILFAANANAVPSFARQTGMNCVACHTSFPELTPFGREFKLNGYTLGEAQWFPFSGMGMVSSTHLKNNNDGYGGKVLAKQNAMEIDQLSVFAGGKINDNMGGFVQWTYVNHPGAVGDPQHHSSLDNTDLRIIRNFTIADKNLLMGITFNNNPTVQDVWNTTPAWGYPFYSPSIIGTPGPTAAMQIDGGFGQTSAGLGAYMWWDRHLYAELSMYGNANRALGFLSAGTRLDPGNSLVGHNNPYWRLAWNEEWGANSLMLGTYGMRFDISHNDGGPTDRYTDTAIDAQYQHISDPSIFTAQATYMHEKQDLRDFAGGASTNSNNSLNVFRGKLSYLYNRTYGATFGFNNITGTSDDSLYSGKPNSRFYTFELNYNYNPQVRFLAQYTLYDKLDQASLTGGGLYSGRSASDNNTLMLATWFAF